MSPSWLLCLVTPFLVAVMGQMPKIPVITNYFTILQITMHITVV